MTDKEIESQRSQYVVKSNDMIRQSRFNLNTVEQKIVLYMISKIDNKNDSELREIEMSIYDFCQVCGIHEKDNLSRLKNCIQDLADKSIWIRVGNTETLMRWIEKPYIEHDTGKIRIKLDRDMIPYLLKLKGNFTQYELMAVLALKSKYSIRLYEIFKSYEYEGHYEATIKDLRKILMIKNEYKVFADFKRYVIDTAIEEIERFTDLEIEYTFIKDVRKVIGFSFTITNNGEKDYLPAKLFLDGRIPTRHALNERYKEVIKEIEEVATDTDLFIKDDNQTSLFGDEE